MERKLFLDVFPGIRLDDETESYMQEVWVTSVKFWRETGRLLVGIASGHVIPKHMVYTAERAVRIYVFGVYGRGSVKIQESFTLPGVYTPEKIFDVYRDSFTEELEQESPVDRCLLRGAEIRFQDGAVIFSVQDGPLIRSRAKGIETYYQDCLQHRFGMQVTVRVLFDRPAASQEPSSEKVPAEAKKESRQEIPAGTENRQEEKEEKKQEKTPFESYDLSKNVVVYDKSSVKSAAAKQEVPKKDYKKNLETYKTRNFNDPDCFYGKNTEGDLTEIRNITEETFGEVVLRGRVFGMEARKTRKGDKYILTANLTDFTDSISFKLFVREEDYAPISEDLHDGVFVRMKCVVKYDTWTNELAAVQVNGIKKIPDWRKPREDHAEKKRVELHLHTVMSEMDAVTDIGKAVQQAIDWGHKALAITDHGVAQAFPVAFHYLQDNAKKIPPDFKLIYGIEGNLVDDLQTLVMNPHGQSLDSEYVVFDIETTGLSFEKCRIIEIGAVRIDAKGKEIGRFSEFVNPEEPIPFHIQQLTSITDDTVKDAPPIEVVLPKFLDFCKDAMLVAHNATFDTTFIRIWARKLGLSYDFTALDTMTLAYVFVPDLGRYTLDRLTNYFKLKNQHHHRACDDADVTAKIFMKLMELIREKKAENVEDLNRMGQDSPDKIRKAKSYHGTILIQNETGRVNLYRLISEAHITYFNRRPKIPMSLIRKYREGLLLGSACSEGQLYQAILDGREEEEIDRIAGFFDYFEIQPCANNRHLIQDEKAAAVQSEEDLQEINRKIIRLGRKFGKPVVATGDVHFLNPEDAIYRTIIQEGSKPKSSGKKNAPVVQAADQDSVAAEMRRQPPLYFHTTEEMLKEFEFLGPETAREVVVENPGRLADQIEKIEPVRPDKCPPVIPDSDKTLRDICHKRAHEIYGPELPQIVSDRLEKELNSIIGNGYSVMYIIAQKLVWQSNSDGYLVGSRGSVGSSFAATMAGITEVNPLPPHYICPKCYYTEFDSERVKKYSGMSGCDMPDADCPRCGTKMIKEGHDIPFETFLGFKGDKEPDIDLNFSGEYQPRAHAFIEKIFGKGKAFRAGTIGTVAENTAYGYVMRYCENRGIHKRSAEMDRLAEGCTGVKRTTGQHPGGIIVLPPDEEIYSFTPIQKPANDMTVSTITTHFEYHSIQQNLLKFDILGHDDPTMIRRLEDLTGLKATEVPLDDKKVMRMFQSTEPLELTPDQIGGTTKSTLGIPEFGTDFAMQMLEEAKPECFSDLVRIAGLAHGTDVWLGNAEVLIKEGKCKLSSAICCRDDIMVYLLHMGLGPGEAFTIMERVRKGTVAKGKCKEWPQFKKDMEAHGVPDWYIGSCEKIKYMFPKAHAVAYVMMAWRVAWFKLYHPLEYYAAFFSIRATAFNYEIMCQGEDHLNQVLQEYRAKDKNSMTAKESDLLRDMRIVQEMYERGFSFAPIDIYKAKANRFQIVDGKIMPSFVSIDGMGDKAAAQLEEAAKKGKFLSQQEIKDRGKVTGTVVDKMAALGILGELPKENQLTFDFL